MERRPHSIFGLTSRFLGLKWGAASRGTKVAVVVSLVAGGLFLASSVQCIASRACGASNSCPYSSAAATSDTPCSRR